jgi:hypothetical protein
MISEIQLDKAMNYLAETDAEGAELKADVQRTEFMAKVTEALWFKQAEGGVEERRQYVKTLEPVKDAWEKHFAAITKYETVRAKRERAVLVVDVYRTQASNRRAGL